MQIQSYDQNGQPILVPLPGQEMPAPNELTFSQRFNQNTRLRDAIAAAQEIPTATKDMTPGQKIAAANAAKGDPISANVSKIATNPHAKATSQAFISAISDSVVLYFFAIFQRLSPSLHIYTIILGALDKS